jgi:mono/diheme cytochrome c family protein
MTKLRFSILALGLLIPISFAAEDWELPLDQPQLKPGPGMEVVATNCQICHSSDYISTQPPLNRATWSATIQKMREKYGAQVPTNQIEQIVDYLVATYGKQ